MFALFKEFIFSGINLLMIKKKHNNKQKANTEEPKVTLMKRGAWVFESYLCFVFCTLLLIR